MARVSSWSFFIGFIVAVTSVSLVFCLNQNIHQQHMQMQERLNKKIPQARTIQKPVIKSSPSQAEVKRTASEVPQRSSEGRLTPEVPVEEARKSGGGASVKPNTGRKSSPTEVPVPGNDEVIFIDEGDKDDDQPNPKYPDPDLDNEDGGLGDRGEGEDMEDEVHHDEDVDEEGHFQEQYRGLPREGREQVGMLALEDLEDIITAHEFIVLHFVAEGCDKCELFRPHFASAAKKFWEIEEEREGQTVFFYEVNDPQLMVKFNLRELPTVFFFRNGIPILYEGNLNTESLARWIFNHMEVMGWEMQDDNFDVETQRKNEDGSSVTWIVHFCNVDTPGCDGFMATWESAAYRLKGVAEFGYVDVAIEITLAKRLNIDMNNLPAVILIKDNQLFWCTLPLMELTTDSIIHFVTKGHLQIEEEQLPSKLSALAALIVRAGANINAIVATVIATTVVFYGIYIYIRRRKRLADMGKEKGV